MSVLYQRCDKPEGRDGAADCSTPARRRRERPRRPGRARAFRKRRRRAAQQPADARRDGGPPRCRCQRPPHCRRFSGMPAALRRRQLYRYVPLGSPRVRDARERQHRACREGLGGAPLGEPPPQPPPAPQPALGEPQPGAAARAGRPGGGREGRDRLRGFRCGDRGCHRPVSPPCCDA